MLIIPVIDLKDGLAVHASGGRRDAYAPVASRLCRSPEPTEVVDAYCTYFPFSHIYIADLNALGGDAERHGALLFELTQRYAHLEFWIDAGLDLPGACPWRPVIGTESLACAREWQAHRHLDPILSLDFRADRLLTKAPFDTGALPSDELIVMELDRVGAGPGPGLERLQRLRAERPNARIFAAGGVRETADLRRLAEAGINGALIATALHHGRISAADLAALDR